jgi:hypothetical protein
MMIVDFEDGLPNGFTPRGDDGRDTSVLTVTGDEARSGNYSLLVTGRSHSWNGPSLRVGGFVEADNTYAVSVWVLLKSPNSAQMVLSTQFRQGGSEQYRNIQSQNVSRADGWTELTGVFTYTEAMDLSDATIYVESADAGAEFYIDDVTITKVKVIKLWEASGGVSRHADTIGGYDYELWSQNGVGTATMAVTDGGGNGGAFTASWDRTLNVLFRSGKKFSDTRGRDLRDASQAGRAHTEIGEITIDFEAEWRTNDGAAFISVYGWAFFGEGSVPSLTHNGRTGTAFTNQIEFYIIQDRNGWNPGTANNATKKGEAVIDGIVFEIFESDRIGQPSIAASSANFKQYWSIPKNPSDHRLSGRISVSEHFRAWESVGMVMDGPFYEVAMKAESYSGNQNGTGTASVTKNILLINGERIE